MILLFQGELAFASIPKLVKYNSFKAALEVKGPGNIINILPALYPALCTTSNVPAVPAGFSAVNSSLYPKTRIVLYWHFSEFL